MQSACAVFYCHLWPVRHYHTHTHYLRNSKILGNKKFIECKMCALIFSTTFVSKISHFKNNSVRYYHKCTRVFMQSNRCSCQIFIKVLFSRQTFQNFSDIELHENLSSGSRFVAFGQTDMTVTVASRNSANAPDNWHKERWHLVVWWELN